MDGTGRVPNDTCSCGAQKEITQTGFMRPHDDAVDLMFGCEINNAAIGMAHHHLGLHPLKVVGFVCKFCTGGRPYLCPTQFAGRPEGTKPRLSSPASIRHSSKTILLAAKPATPAMK